MKSANWLKKSFVVLVTILTFGLVTPSDFHWLAQAESGKSPKKDSVQNADTPFLHNATPYKSEPLNRELFVKEMLKKAERNSYMKFGDKINVRIGNEFKEVILPKMEETIDQIATQFPEEELIQLVVSEKPAAGRGEKIFHIYNENTNEDIIRFHVRQENPPQEGYWFNFHYHTYHDKFVTHYELGMLYWDKNTPPKWADNVYLS